MLAGIGGLLGGSAVTGGGAYAYAATTDAPENEPHSAPQPTTTAVHTTSAGTSTSIPTPTTTTTTPTTTPESTTTTTSAPTCDAEEFSCEVFSKAKQLGLQVRKSVVYIAAKYDKYSYAQGTGWFLDSKGHIVTNHHVIDGAKEFKIWTVDGTEYSATVKGQSKSPDVALLKIDADSTPSLPIGSSSTLEKEQPVLDVGHPSTVGNWIISLGRYTGPVRYEESPNDLGTSLPGTQGNSGSPLMTLDGSVAGLTYGGMPKEARMPGETPKVTDDRVHEELDPRMVALHVPIERAMEHVRKWK